MAFSSQVFKTSKDGSLMDVLGSLFQCSTTFLNGNFFLMSSLSLPDQNWWSLACVTSSATTKRSWIGDRPVGYLCTIAVKMISSYSACVTEQKVITISTAYSRSHLVSWNIMSSISDPSCCTLPPGVKGRTCWWYHAGDLSKKRSDCLNIHLCKYFTSVQANTFNNLFNYDKHPFKEY